MDLRICVAKSRVGAKMTELTYLSVNLTSRSLDFKTEWMTGRPKAKVLPVPVFARTTIPCSEETKSLMHCSWTGVRVGPMVFAKALFKVGWRFVSSTTLELMSFTASAA